MGGWAGRWFKQSVRAERAYKLAENSPVLEDEGWGTGMGGHVGGCWDRQGSGILAWDPILELPQHTFPTAAESILTSSFHSQAKSILFVILFVV